MAQLKDTIIDGDLVVNGNIICNNPSEEALGNGFYAVIDGKKCTFYFNEYAIVVAEGFVVDGKYKPAHEVFFPCYIQGAEPCMGAFTLGGALRFYKPDFSQYIPNGVVVNGTTTFDLI